MRLGVSLPQFSTDAARLEEAAVAAEDCGLDSIWLFDHLWPLSGGKERPVLECWTTLAWLAERTTAIEIGTLVTRSTLRHPGLLAKMAATVATVVPGRLTVALGSGDAASRPENDAFGIPYFADDARISQLRSTAEAFMAFASGGVADFADAYTRLQLPISPLPPSRPRLWLGGRSGDVLSIAGSLADGWNAWGGTPQTFARDAALVAEAGRGRPIELSYGGLAVLAPTDEEAARAGRDPARYVTGGPETVGQRLASYVRVGARHVIVGLHRPSPQGYELLAAGVRPLLEAAAP